MWFPEFEYGTIEDWRKYEHVPSDQVGKKSDGVPERALELIATWTRTCIEVSLVVSGEEQNIISKEIWDPPEEFLPAKTEKVAVTELSLEQDEDADGHAQGG